MQSISKSRNSSGFDWTGIIMLTLPPLFWAGNFIVGRAMRDAVPPLSLSFYRWLIALVCLAPFAWRALWQDRVHYWRHRWRVFGIAATGLTAFNVLVYIGLHSTSAANAMLLNSFIPLLISGVGAVLYRHRLLASQWLGIAISFLGVLVIVSHGDLAVLLALKVEQGDLYVFAATVCWAFYTLWLRKIPSEIDRFGLMLLQIMIALVLLLPILLWETSAGQHAVWTWQALLAIGYIGIFPSVLAFMLYAAGVARVGAARASLFIHLIPVFGALLSVGFLGESLHLYHMLGMTTIFMGVLLANKTAPQQR